MGTEYFPNLGRHCYHDDCGKLDFLPFKCTGCGLFFCLDHRSYGAHHCPMSDINSRRVVVCNVCSAAVQISGLSDERAALQSHHKSGTCDPSKKKKPTCPVKRCKEILTFSNTVNCRDCGVKVCLNHRFEPADHHCTSVPYSRFSAPARPMKRKDMFLECLSKKRQVLLEQELALRSHPSSLPLENTVSPPRQLSLDSPLPEQNLPPPPPPPQNTVSPLPSFSNINRQSDNSAIPAQTIILPPPKLKMIESQWRFLVMGVFLTAAGATLQSLQNRVRCCNNYRCS